MRPASFSFVLILATAMSALPVCAQSGKEAKAPSPASEVRYFRSLGGILGEIIEDPADGILKETQTAGKVTGAVLDVCYPIIRNSNRNDRFIVMLSVEGQKLTGTTESLNSKQPVTVNLVRKSTAGGVTFEGEITVGNRTSNVSASDMTEIREKEFNKGQEFDDQIILSPSDFITTPASPGAVAVRLKRENVAGFVNSLRGQNVEFLFTSLFPFCSELRRGEQVIRMNVDPERAADFVARMKTISGVIAAGWTSGRIDRERTIRLPASDWREGGKLNKNKFAAALSDIMAKTLSATALASKWNDDSGELKLTFRRPDAALPGLGLTQTIEFSALAANDKPGASDKLLLWISYPAMTTSDESPGAKLKFSDAADSASEGSIPIDESDIVAAVAHEMKAQRWDSESSSWK